MLCKTGLYLLPDFARTVWKYSPNKIPTRYFWICKIDPDMASQFEHYLMKKCLKEQAASAESFMETFFPNNIFTLWPTLIEARSPLDG